jgi:DeoR family transcriptional regulator of aga operon
MVINERQQQIVDILLAQKTATVAELSDLLDVSAVTIRNDLNLLADSGRVLRTHGGARIADGRLHQEQTFATRQRLNADQKQAIGDLAATLITPLEPILLDGSTTAVAVARALKRQSIQHELTVVTTGIWTALELLGSPYINVVLAGGYVRNVTGSITGSITMQVLERFSFSKVFLGAWGINLNEGVTDTHLAEVELKQRIIDRAKDVVIVADSTKFGRTGLSSFASINQITHIVTDSAAPPDMVEILQARGVTVLAGSS